MPKYDHTEVEKKWQRKWAQDNLYQTPEPSNEKRYVLVMFPYPSGAGLHVGHVEGYTAGDIYARFLRMNGHPVLHPMGWDAFGLPAENYAIKTGTHPRETTETAINTFKEQIESLGLSYDWGREVGTHNPDYYRWTQWLFLQLYKNNLAYKKKAAVNWCESCQTVLANEQVIDGACERCENEVIQKELEQWFFKIREYADQLVDDLDTIDWPESTKLAQRNWVGRSEGAEIDFPVAGSEHTIKIFTTRPDTLFGATYMVLAPEHAFIDGLKERITNWDAVEEYRVQAAKKSELERQALQKEKTGIMLEGVVAVNPATNEEIPVFIADYVLAHYGTGAIMAVPAHDERDFEFAEKYNLKKVCVIDPDPHYEVEIQLNVPPEKHAEAFTQRLSEIHSGEFVYTGPGVLMNSKEFNDLSSEEAKQKITAHVGGTMTTTYKLRDWLVSRQRYWGAPIPIVYDPDGKPHPVPEEHLPWELPDDVEFKPTGTAPLAQSEELCERTERIFGAGWTPEVDTFDTFVDSSWYFLRYADAHNDEVFAERTKLDAWLPVDTYIGGAEHTVLHLLYSRFITKALRDLGHLDFDEPFMQMRHQGIILGEDGRKMSKRWGNVVNPTDVVDEHGADTLRIYEMFMGPLEDMKAWNSNNIFGARRFLEKAWRLREKARDGAEENERVQRALHAMVQKVTEDISVFKFHTAISAMMICANALTEEDTLSYETLGIFARTLAPFAPHIAEELWAATGKADSVHTQAWPQADPAYLTEDTATITIQFNGRTRGTVDVPAGADETAVRSAVPASLLARWGGAGEPERVIFVPDRLINFVVSQPDEPRS